MAPSRDLRGSDEDPLRTELRRILNARSAGQLPDSIATDRIEALDRHPNTKLRGDPRFPRLSPEVVPEEVREVEEREEEPEL